MCISAIVHYIGADFATLAINSALRRVSDCDQKIGKCHSRLLFSILRFSNRARDIYKTSAWAAYQTSSLFASPISTTLENLSVNRQDWKCNFEIIARYIKVRHMQLCSTLYLIQRNVQNTCYFCQDIYYGLTSTISNLKRTNIVNSLKSNF